MKRRYFLSFFAVGAVFTLLFCLISRLCEPKYVTASREGNLISEYYREVDALREHEVVFIGDCEVYSSIVPPVLYSEFGITSFVRGSPSQSVAQSYHLLCETLKYETPRVVVVGVYAVCKSGTSAEAYNRMTLDGMRASAEKWRAVRDSLSEGESAMSYILPLLRFHTRIFELEAVDFKYLFTRPSVSHNGYLLNTATVPQKGDIAPEGEALSPLPPENLEMLGRMAELCRESGVELVLLKPPTSSWRYPWYSQWDDELYELAARQNITYYSLNSEECGIDMALDSFDGGMHLNAMGAEKVSAHFGALLVARHGVGGNKNDVWERKAEKYYNERNAQCNGDQGSR